MIYDAFITFRRLAVDSVNCLYISSSNDIQHVTEDS